MCLAELVVRFDGNALGALAVGWTGTVAADFFAVSSQKSSNNSTVLSPQDRLWQPRPHLLRAASSAMSGDDGVLVFCLEEVGRFKLEAAEATDEGRSPAASASSVGVSSMNKLGTFKCSWIAH
jgi:hypothetical protein